MNEDTFNMQVRMYLKKVGIRSQREIEQAVRRALAENTLDPAAHLDVSVRLTLPALGVEVDIQDTIRLE